MTVYVDDAQIPGPPVPRFGGRMRMCHMTADTLEQLYEMADALRIDRRHFQDTDKPHYDIALSKRNEAVSLHGAALVDTKTIVRVAKRLRARMDK